ncbi:MAG: hypothetical protein RL145_270 [Pseudomonadota bacterium]|jgi:hypothetical protein
MSHHKDDAAHESHDNDEKKTTWTENVELVGDELIASVKKLAAEGKVRRIRIIEPDGDIVVDMPLTLGAIAGGAVVLAAPMLAILGALASYVTKVRIEIVRSGPGPAKPTDKKEPMPV